MITAIIVAAGSSRRMGSDKLFALLDGIPVVAHAISAFEKCRDVAEIILVTRQERIEEMRELVVSSRFQKVKQVIAGGAERHFSVWNGLQAVRTGSDFIAIHDGARPLVTPRLIEECFALAQKEGAACLATPIPDTIKRSADDHHVTESVERNGLWAMQTPQIFSRHLILEAYSAVIAKNRLVTDEVSAVQGLGKKIALVRNEEWNFKITFPRDLELAEQILALRKSKSKAQKKKPGAVANE
jgi:2-C-methyl-D-erythritol 4-phosphate cytidylyltransferase